MERNVRLIGVHQALSGALVWMPVFVLFTRARFDLDGAILLAALYYLFVVVLEVPSGWMSDRFGRVLTLRVAASGWIIAHLCFAFGGDTFWLVLTGQVFMAVGFASLSGTDVSFHYDTLEALGRAATYAERQARVAAGGLISTSVSVLVGGLLGLIDLRIPFFVAIGLAIAQLVLTLSLNEPPHEVTRDEIVPGQLRAVVGYLRDAPMKWLFVYGVALVTLEHVAASLFQPWLTGALNRSAEELGSTPVVSGIVMALTAMVGALAARFSAPVSARFGPAKTLIGLGLISAVIVSAMAALAHPIVLALVALRSVQGAAAPVIISAVAAPRVQRSHRATFLSLNSLAGRLGYGLILLFVASGADDNVASALLVLTIIAWSVLIVTAALARLLRARELGL